MFNFSKKKSQPQSAQPPQAAPPGVNDNGNSNNASNNKNVPAQSFTKVEDETASFEIPDFTEDDLNFDLGISEFAPEPGQEKQIPPTPKGMPIDAPPAGMNSGKVPQPQQVQQTQIPKQTQQGVESEPSMPPEPEEVPEMPEPAEEQTQDEREGQPEETEGEEGDIPKFDVEPPTNVKDINLEPKPVRREPPARNVRREISSLLEAQARKEPEPQHPGVFMPSPIYEKVVILTEDTLKQSIYGEGAKAKISSLMDSKKLNAEDLAKLTRTMIDSLLSCDAKLFEKVVQDGE